MKALKNLLAVAVIATSAQSAFAYWDTGVDTVNRSGVNDGEAILTIFDTTNQLSYSQDLGVRYSALYSGSAFNGSSINLDPTALSVFGGNYSGVQWNISAANSHIKNGTTNAFTGAGYIMSYSTGTVLTAPGNIGSNINGVWGTFNPYQTNLAMIATAADPTAATNLVRSGTAAGANETSYQAQWATNSVNYGAWEFVGSGTSTQNLWFTGYGTANGLGAGASKVTKLGSVSLDVNGKTLTLNAAVSQVPVPAAAWLMGSALLGLGGIGRSRKQRA